MLTYNFSNARGIFFPAGLPPDGTCFYATEACLKYCCIYKKTLSHKIIIGYEKKKKALDYFITQPVRVIVNKLRQEYNNKILYWFASGDCPLGYEKKIAQIIRHLSPETPQNGFTRNKKLYNFLTNEKNVRLMLTIEKPSFEDFINTDRLAVPNYKTGLVDIYIKQKLVAKCSSESCGEFEDNCTACYQSGRGCFYGMFKNGLSY